MPGCKKIAIQFIDLTRDQFRISRYRSTARLERSLQAVGCLEPLLALNPENPILISGFRRVEAALKLGMETLPVCFLEGEIEESHVFHLALHLFLSTGHPHPVEQSVILRKLEQWFSRDEILERYFPLLEIHPSAVIYRRIRAILDLPLSAQEALASGLLDEVCVPHLERLNEADRQPAIQLLLDLSPSKSSQKEILEYLHDLSLREEVPISTLLQEEAVQRIFTRRPANLPQQREAFRHWLKARRFPVLHQAKTKFEQTCKTLKISDKVKLIPPPFYEGREYEVRFSFREPEEFRRRLETLQQMAQQPDVLKKLWE